MWRKNKRRITFPSEAEYSTHTPTDVRMAPSREGTRGLGIICGLLKGTLGQRHNPGPNLQVLEEQNARNLNP